MQDFSFDQFSLMYNMLSFALATMWVSFVFFVLAQQQVAKNYHTFAPFYWVHGILPNRLQAAFSYAALRSK